MRVAVTGSNGLLGTKLLELLLPRADVEVVALSRAPRANGSLGACEFHQVDLTEPGAAQRVFVETRPEVVIHTAAMTDVDGCEREPERAWRENVDATREVALGAHAVDAHLVHLSTEYVFDGTAGPYGEDDPVCPQGVYARSKLASEDVLREVLPGSVVARTTVVFGTAPYVRPNYVTWLIARLRGREPARVVTDQLGSPTLADNLARMVWTLGQDRAAAGVFNTAGGTVIDRFAFAQLIAREFDLDEGLLEPTDTASLRQLAPRPLRAGLRMQKFRAAYPEVPVLSAAEALRVLHAQLDGVT